MNNNQSLLAMLEGCTKSDTRYCEEKEICDMNRASELESLGFTKVANDLITKMARTRKLAMTTQYGYIRVMPTKIQEYLKRLADEYNKNHEKPKKQNASSPWLDWLNGNAFYSLYRPMGILGYLNQGASNERKTETFEEETNHYASTRKNTIGKFVYTEIPIADYPDIPPQNTLNILKEHQDRQVFDYFTIAKVTHIPDPILFGRIEGCDDRFFICQWGNDLTLDDII